MSEEQSLEESKPTGRNLVQRRREGIKPADKQTLAPSTTIFRFY